MKRVYMEPSIKVVNITIASSLMAGSQFSEEVKTENGDEDAGSYSRRGSSIWDDEED